MSDGFVIEGETPPRLGVRCPASGWKPPSRLVAFGGRARCVCCGRELYLRAGTLPYHKRPAGSA